MKVRLLGTGAADGIPSLFGGGPANEYARTHGGKDIRTRAAALLDENIKIDFGPDTLSQVHRERLNPEDWSAVVFTHSDDDHLDVNELQYFLFPFCENEFMPFTIYGNHEVVRKVSEKYPAWPFDLVETKAFQPFAHAGYTITPVHAQHGEEEENHNLIFQRDGKTLIYATDTGVWGDETFEFTRGLEAAALVIECTDGLSESLWQGHLNLMTCLGMVRKMSELAVIAPDARICTTHHSYTGGRHCDLVKALGAHGIETGYDGLVLEF